MCRLLGKWGEKRKGDYCIMFFQQNILLLTGFNRKVERIVQWTPVYAYHLDSVVNISLYLSYIHPIFYPFSINLFLIHLFFLMHFKVCCRWRHQYILPLHISVYIYIYNSVFLYGYFSLFWGKIFIRWNAQDFIIPFNEFWQPVKPKSFKI